MIIQISTPTHVRFLIQNTVITIYLLIKVHQLVWVAFTHLVLEEVAAADVREPLAEMDVIGLRFQVIT